MRITPFLFLSIALFAQDNTGQPASGWRKATEADAPVAEAPVAEEAPPQRRAPDKIVIPAGTWIKVRVDEPLSSDRSQPGQAFTATLAQPLVMDGIVVARRGQTLEGRVTEAIKAGRIKGTSRLGVEMTELQLADGQQIPVRTQLVDYRGDTSKGRDAAGAATATGAGAAIGAAAAGGFGAGMGAIAGAGASAIGILATRGRATEIYPESVITFRIIEPLTVNTERAPHAYLPARQNDYERSTARMETRPSLQRQPAYLPFVYDPFFYSWPGYWGPGMGVWGGRWWGPRYYTGVGVGRGWGGGGWGGRGRRW